MHQTQDIKCLTHIYMYEQPHILLSDYKISGGLGDYSVIGNHIYKSVNIKKID